MLPAQVKLAVRWNVPTLLLIREPVGAVTSATVYLEHDDPFPFLKFFNIYHRALVPYRDQIVLSDFQHTTTNFGSVIAEINRRYGRDFDLYRGTPEDEQRVKEMIREEHRERLDGRPARLPLPSSEKDVLKEQVKQKLLEPRCAGPARRSAAVVPTLPLRVLRRIRTYLRTAGPINCGFRLMGS